MLEVKIGQEQVGGCVLAPGLRVTKSYLSVTKSNPEFRCATKWTRRSCLSDFDSFYTGLNTHAPAYRAKSLLGHWKYINGILSVSLRKRWYKEIFLREIRRKIYLILTLWHFRVIFEILNHFTNLKTSNLYCFYN